MARWGGQGVRVTLGFGEEMQSSGLGCRGTQRIINSMNRRGWNEASTRAARKVNGLRESAGNRASVAGSAVHLFDAEPMMHPNVLDAYKQAARVLKKKRIQFRETGGIALNLRGAGRPTKDIDLVVRRSDWLRAIQAVSEIATDRPGIRFGLPQKPEAGLAVIGPHGVPIELWPEGTTHEQIARIRGMQKGASASCGQTGIYIARRRHRCVHKR